MPPSLAEAVHFVSSVSAAGCVKQAGANPTRIYYSDDDLTTGPCDVDSVRHEELRRAWDTKGWKRRLGLDHLRAAIASDEPVVLWGTRAYSDLVWLWWALHGLGRVGAEGPRFFLARPQPGDSLAEVGGATPEEARIAFESVRPVTRDEWREGADLWIRFASRSPLAFDEARRAGSSAFPELTSSAELHGAWFPRLTNARLCLSELDEALLRGIDDSWRRTSDVLQTLSPGRLAPLIYAFDPFFCIYRLRAWATHGVLERESIAEENPYAQDRFRTTDKARALLGHGLDSVADAPQLYVGGCVVNDPASPWVRIDDDSGWRLVLQ